MSILSWREWQAHPERAFPRESRGQTQPSERVARLRQRLLENERHIDTERALLTTEAYRVTEGQPMAVRRATVLRYLAERLSITLGADDLIVGNRSFLPRMGVIAPEGAVDWLDRELETLPTRAQDRFEIHQTDIELLRESVFPYWLGRTLEDRVAKSLPEDVRRAVAGGVVKLNQTDHAQGHILPDVEGWLRLGIGGLRRRLQAARRGRGPLSPEQAAFYRAGEIALDAAATYIRSYGELALESAEDEADPGREGELRTIAERCEWLSEHPARGWWDALQALWFLFVLLQMESNASSFSPGRMDQYLLPYLERDLEAGQLTLAEAQEALEHLWCKFNEIVLLRSGSSARYFAGFPIGFNIVVGGQRADGSDATNPISYMCLRAQAHVGLTQPNLSVRIHADSPQPFLLAAAHVIGLGSGMPQVFNDEVIIPAQMGRGVTQEDAYNYAVVGCVELSTPGKALGWSDAAMFNLVRVLELTLNGGRDPQTGEQIGLPTPDLTQLASYEALEAAYGAQVRHFLALLVKGCDVVDWLHAELLPSPLLSLVVDDCIMRGLDVTAGGAHYNFSGVQGVQVANVADSLAAVRQAVYDEGWLSAEELLTALRADWQGYEVLRQRLLAEAPHYGNDDARVDTLAAHWGDLFCEWISEYRNVRGGPYHPGFYTVSAHMPMGAHVGAMPDGRHAGEPLADGGLSPSAGRDRCGPTAVLQSVSRLNLELASNGTLLNMKFMPALFEQASGLEAFCSLLRTFCRLQIPHVQFNVVSGETLRQAQAQPEAYRHLVVRVAGYSAYFCELDRGLQDEIIRRTAFAAVDGCPAQGC